MDKQDWQPVGVSRRKTYWTPERRKQHSETMKSQWTPERREALSQKVSGRRCSDEQRENMRRGWERRKKNSLLQPDGVGPNAVTVDPETGCHLWNGSMSVNNKRGAPFAWFDGRLVNVRRHVYRVATGKAIPSNRSIRVSCGNDRCVNLDHLVIGGLGKPTLATPEQIEEIRRLSPTTAPSDIAERLQIPIDRVRSYQRRYRMDVGPFHYPTKTRVRWAGGIPDQPDGVPDRDWSIFSRVVSGEAMRSVGKDYGITGARTSQVVQKVESYLSGDRATYHNHKKMLPSSTKSSLIQRPREEGGGRRPNAYIDWHGRLPDRPSGILDHHWEMFCRVVNGEPQKDVAYRFQVSPEQASQTVRDVSFQCWRQEGLRARRERNRVDEGRGERPVDPGQPGGGGSTVAGASPANEPEHGSAHS